MADLDLIIQSLKGLASGSGNVLGEFVRRQGEVVRAMEPGDYINTLSKKATAAPLASDLWYLWSHDNFLSHYQSSPPLPDDTYDYTSYISECMNKFMTVLPGLKPLKTLKKLSQFAPNIEEDAYGVKYQRDWLNNGTYWINTLAFENWLSDQSIQYSSDGPKGFQPNDYVGYLAFPVGQIGVIEVISILREVALSGYKFVGEELLPRFSPGVEDTPVAKMPPEIFPDPIAGHSGNNWCHGQHLAENGYNTPDLLTAKRDVEWLASNLDKYAEDIKPKRWMRFWMHKDNKWPVPGEFIGILCKPVNIPPHVWWYQESNPFLYAGNWVETSNLTSGIVTKVTLEEDRTDDKDGNLYNVMIQGVEVTIEASDYLVYSVNDRVAVLKVDSTKPYSWKGTSFTWNDQVAFKDTDKGKKKTNYIIIPITFYD